MIFPPPELLRHFEWDKIEQSKAVSNMCFLLSIKQPVHCRPPLSTGMCWQSSSTKEGGLSFQKGLPEVPEWGCKPLAQDAVSFQLPSSAVLWPQLRTYSENVMVLLFPQLSSQPSRGPRSRDSEVIPDHRRARRGVGGWGGWGEKSITPTSTCSFTAEQRSGLWEVY